MEVKDSLVKHLRSSLNESLTTTWGVERRGGEHRAHATVKRVERVETEKEREIKRA